MDVLAVATKGSSSPVLVTLVLVFIVLVAVGILISKLRK